MPDVVDDDDLDDDHNASVHSPAAPEVQPVRRRRSLVREPKPSLASPLLSGRSLQPIRERSWIRRHIRAVIAVAVLLVLVVGVVVVKNLAESAADTEMTRRSAELEELLEGAQPSDLMAFGAAVETPGSLAQRVRDTDGFVNVTATADLAFVRFQPSGWWSGFTERCLVAYIRPDSVTVQTPKTACVRVEAPPRG